MGDILTSAKQERAELVRQREAIDKRIADLDTFIQVANTIEVRIGDGDNEVPFRTRIQPRKRKSFKDRVISETEKMLAGGRTVPTREIVQELENHGLPVPGKDKVTRISSILGKANGKFRPDRSKGWSLNLEKS